MKTVLMHLIIWVTLAVQKPEVRETKLPSVCKAKNYCKSLVTSSCSTLCVLQMGLEYRDKQGE